MIAAAPTRVQLRRTKGWRMPPNTVRVSRPGIFGNPWTIESARRAGYSDDETQLARWCCELYRGWVTGDPRSITRMLAGGEERVAGVRLRLPGLRGRNLACWCSLGRPCHADVLLELVNGPLAPEAPHAP